MEIMSKIDTIQILDLAGSSHMKSMPTVRRIVAKGDGLKWGFQDHHQFFEILKTWNSQQPATCKNTEPYPLLNTYKSGSHMPAVCLRLYHYTSTCRRNTGKVELKSIFPAYHRCNCGTGGNRRTNVHIVYVLKLPPASSSEHRRHTCEPGFTIDILYTLDSASLLVKLKPRIFQRLPPFE
jgi:hypothetical protein